MGKSIAISLISILVITSAWFYRAQAEAQRVQAVQNARHQLVAHQKKEQRAQRLSDVSAHPLLEALGKELVDIQIGIAQILTEQTSQASYNELSYQQTAVGNTIVEESEAVLGSTVIARVNVLRIMVKASVANGQAVLDLLSDIRKSASGWPVEIRGCDIHRVSSRSLNASCVMDVIHWVAKSS